MTPLKEIEVAFDLTNTHDPSLEENDKLENTGDDYLGFREKLVPSFQMGPEYSQPNSFDVNSIYSHEDDTKSIFEAPALLIPRPTINQTDEPMSRRARLRLHARDLNNLLDSETLSTLGYESD